MTVATTIAALRYGWQTLGAQSMIWGVFVPHRLAVACLSYCFDYVPHHETKGRPQTNPYLVTKRITRFCDHWNGNAWLLRLVVANQDAHVIHHLYPTLPFYKHHSVWDRREKELYQAGVQTTSLF